MVTANLSIGRLFPCFLCLLYFLYPLCLPGLAAAQQPPVDAAEISRDLLYHPARLIESSWAGPELRLAVFRAAEFTYRLLGPANQWEVLREKNDKVAAAVAWARIISSLLLRPTTKASSISAALPAASRWPACASGSASNWPPPGWNSCGRTRPISPRRRWRKTWKLQIRKLRAWPMTALIFGWPSVITPEKAPGALERWSGSIPRQTKRKSISLPSWPPPP